MASSTSRTASSTSRLRPGLSTASVVGAVSSTSRHGAVTTPFGPHASYGGDLPSKHRLIAAQPSTSSMLLPSVPANAPPQPEGDVYIVNLLNVAGGGALSLAYTADCRLLAVGEARGNIRVLRSSKMEELCCLPFQPQAAQAQQQGLQVPAVAAAPDTKGAAVTCIRPWPASATAESTRSALLASYANGKIRLWDVNNCSVVREVSEDRQCLGLAVSPDLQHFVSLGDDGGVYLYDAATCKLLSKLVHSGFHDVVDGHLSRTYSGVFHPSRPHEVVTGGWDNLLHFWDTRTSQSERHAGDTHIAGTEALDISRDGRELMSCSWRNSDQLQTWDYETARLIETVNPDKQQSFLYAGRYLSENLLCCGGSSSNMFRLVHSKQKATLGTVTGLAHGIYSIALGPVGARFQPNPTLNNGRHPLPHSRDKSFRVAICSANKVMEVEVY